jgi:uncharacterized protein (TIGR00725 family)
MTRLYVGVVGAGEATAHELEVAEQVGRLLARAGVVVVCGGLGGVMHAAAHGCAAEGGTSVGVLPGGDRRGASPDLTVAICTGMGEARNAIIARSVDALIAVSGEFGTLSEIALALRMGVPVVGIETWELTRHGAPVDAVARAPDAAGAVALALDRAGNPPLRESAP